MAYESIPLLESAFSPTDAQSLFAMPTPGDQGVLGSVFVLLNTAMGAGTLMMPYCMNSGVLLACLMTVFFALITGLAMSLMIDAAHWTKCYDFKDLFGRSFGERNMWMCNFIIFLLQLGSCVIYCHWCGEMINKILHFKTGILSKEVFWIFAAAVVISPLTMYKSIASLEKFTFLSVGFVVLLIVHAAYFFIDGVRRDGFDPDHKLKLFSFNSVFIVGFSVNAMGFNCIINLFSSLEHLKNCTISRARKVVTYVMLSSMLLYLLFALLCYFHFWDKIGPESALEYYDSSNMFTIIVTFGVVFVLIMCSPLVVWGGRNALHSIFWKEAPTTLRWNVLGIGMVILSATLASSSDNIPMYFDLVGGLCVPVIIYLLPALFYLRSGCPPSCMKSTIAYFLCAFSIATAIICTYQVVKKM